MSIHPGSNALQGPSTSTPAGHKRSTKSRPSRRLPSAKRRRAMPTDAVAVNEEHEGKQQQSNAFGNLDSDGSTTRQSGGLFDLLAKFSRALTFRKADDIQPTPSTSSSVPISTFKDEPGYKPQQFQQGNDPTYADIEREPEDDTIWLPSPMPAPFGLPSTSSASMDGNGYGRRREPMYQEETRARSEQRRARKKQAALENAHASIYRRTPKFGPDSSISGDVSSYGVSSPATNDSVAGVSSAAGTPEWKPSRPLSAYNTSNLGLGEYERLLASRPFGDINNIFSASRIHSRDVLLGRRLPPQQDHEHFNRTLEIAKDSLNTPRPLTPRLPVYGKSRLRDEKLTEQIEDLTKRRRIWPSEIPPENEQIIKAVLRTPGIVATLPAAEVAHKDVIKLQPGEWLNDEVINFYGVMVNIRSANAKARRDKGFAEPGDENLLDVHVFNSFFFQKLVDKPGYPSVRRWTKKFDLFKKDIIIMPVNLGNAHWVCAAINIEKQRFEYYDSMGKMNVNVLNKLREYVEAEHLDKKKVPIDLSGWQNYANPRTPQQANGYDCGVFTSQFIECLSRRDGHFDFDQKNMPYLRRKMIHEIKTMQIAPEQWYDPNA